MRRRDITRACWLIAGMIPGFAAAAVQIEPLVLLAPDRQLTGCGARIQSQRATTDATVLLYVSKDDTGPKTVFQVSVNGPHGAQILHAADLVTDSFRMQDVLGLGTVTDGRYIVERHLGPDRQGAVFRELMLSGGRLELRLAEGAVAIPIPGPAPAQVMRTYLQCTGDLYRSGRSALPP